MKLKHKIWFNKAGAVFWLITGIIAFWFGWQDAVWFVAICSIWANIFSSWSTAEAADIRELLRILKRIEERQTALEQRLEELTHDG